MLDKNDRLVILDFDLAEFLSPDITLNYSIATKGYKAPESFLKQRIYDYRFDVYSAGTILLGMLFEETPEKG